MRKVVTIILLGFFLSGCSVSKRRREAPLKVEAFSDTEKFYDDLKQTNLSSGGFYISRADIDLSTPSLDIKLIGTIKFRFPDSLFVSLRTRTGIEAGRLLLTDDTILVNDRINRMIYYGDPEDLEKKFGISSMAVFAVFGDFIGKPELQTRPVNCIGGTHFCETRLGEYTLKYEIDCYNKKANKAVLSGNTPAKGVQAFFSDFNRYGNVRAPGNIKVLMNDNKGSFTAEIRNIQTDWKGEIDFITGRNYRKVRIR